jgi:hypothetical protein
MRIAAQQARGLKFERKTELSANTLDIRRNCRHIQMLDAHERAHLDDGGSSEPAIRNRTMQ